MLHKRILKHLVVLYGSVVHKREIAVFAVMRMGVAVGRLPVRGPARMGYSYARLNVLVLAEILKSLHFAERLVYVELAVVVNECYSRTVIPSVFQTMESSDEDVVSVPFAYISNYSAHITIIRLYFLMVLV